MCIKNDVLFWEKVAKDVIEENLVLKTRIRHLEEQMAMIEDHFDRHNRGVIFEDENGVLKTKAGFYLR